MNESPYVEALRLIRGRLLDILDGMAGSRAMQLKEEVQNLNTVIRDMERGPVSQPVVKRQALPPEYPSPLRKYRP